MISILKNYFSSSRLVSLLLLIFFTSCNKKLETEKKSNKDVNYKKPITEISHKDSVKISISLEFDKLVTNNSTGFNLHDKYGDNFYFHFDNENQKDTIVIKYLSNEYQTLKYLEGWGFVDNRGEVNVKHFRHNYLVTNNTKSIDFTHSKGDIKLNSYEGELYILDSLYASYRNFNLYDLKNKKSTQNNLLQKADNIYNYYNNKYSKSSQTIPSNINKLLFIEKLSNIYPSDKRIEEYLNKTKLSEIPRGGEISTIQYINAKKHINSNSFKDENFTPEYSEHLAIGLFRFLKFEDNKGDPKYEDAVAWLKTTELYKNDSLYIKKEITPLSNATFKNKLSKLDVSNISNKTTSFSQLIKQHPSPYYLIDFWATWCAPCIQGVKTMDKMDMPKNVKVISLSLDKVKDKDKWKAKTKELKQSITYWLDEEREESKAFLKFIEVQSIPRYILIDKNMSLIDQAFYHPQEPQFLPKLQDVKNHKFW